MYISGTTIGYSFFTIKGFLSMKAISHQVFADKRFKRYDSYQFAAKDALAPIVIREMPKACVTLPIGFTQIGEGFAPVVVQSLLPGRNLFVGPDGRWIGPYIPAVYRGYPFGLAKTEDERQVLCFEEDSGLLSEDGESGEPFFGDDGKPTKAVNDILDFLTQLSVNRQTTQRICGLLKEHGLIQPWPIKLQGPENAGSAQNIEGLFRIDEGAFNAISAEALVSLRDGGALLMIFCQLLSMQHISALGELLKAAQAAEQQAALPKTDTGEIDLSFLADDTSLSFDHL
jgi:hypothetical protein